MPFKTVFLLCSVSSSVVVASPSFYNAPPQLPQMVLIDCDDMVLREEMTNAGALIRCEPRTNSNYPDEEMNSIYEYDEPLSSVARCEGAFVYVDDIGMCLPWSLLNSAAANEAGDLNNQQNFQNFLEYPCRSGYVFNKEETICIPISPAKIDVEHFTTNSECSDGKVFISEIGKCLPVSLQKDTETVTADVSSPKQDTEKIANDMSPPKQCPPGTAYSQKLDNCLSIHKLGSIAMTSALPKFSDKSFKIPGSNEVSKSNKSKWRKCEEGSIYVSEIHLCITYAAKKSNYLIKTQHGKEISTSTTKSHPLRLTLEPLTSDKVGRRKCLDGMVYVSEIDHCLFP